jgi:hypothetical protein
MGGHRDEETGKYVAYASNLDRYKWTVPAPPRPEVPVGAMPGFSEARGYVMPVGLPFRPASDGKLTLPGILQDLEDACSKQAFGLRDAQ